MNMIEICEHEQKIDNDERQHVELDRKNKNITKTTNLCVNMTKKCILFNIFGLIQLGMFVVVEFFTIFLIFGHIQSFSVMFKKYTFIIVNIRSCSHK